MMNPAAMQNAMSMMQGMGGMPGGMGGMGGMPPGMGGMGGMPPGMMGMDPAMM